MNALDVLVAARALIADPANWTQGRFQKTIVQFDPPAPGDGFAYCARGAIYATAPRTGDCVTALMILRRAISSTKWDGIVAWNDHPQRTHAQVLAAFDKAIKIAARDET